MAVLSQERHVELVSGASEAFVVTSLMASATIPAQLPHLNVFVLTVNDVDDPKQDVLARVARIADLSLVPIGRDAGIAAPTIEGIQYLSASTTNIYDTLETANDAAVAFQDRVNALIEGWITFRTEFNAPDPSPALYTLPRVDPSQKTALINAYKAAKQDRYVKNLAKVEADAVLTRALADFTFKSSLITDLTEVVTESTTVEANMTDVVGGFTAFVPAGNTFYAAASGTPPSAPEKADFQTALIIAGQTVVLASVYTVHTSNLTSLITTYQSARTSASTAAASAVTVAQADQLTKAQLRTSAVTLEAAALAAVLAVCPDFDKHSIAFVDDTEP